jgi:hypothetical protein
MTITKDTATSSTTSEGKLAWDLLVELRKEILESQKIRAHIIGVKVTFVGVLVAAIAGHSEKIPLAVLAVPAFAAMFFDFLIASYGYNIKRIGFYIHEFLEPKLKQSFAWTNNTPMWEDFLHAHAPQQFLGVAANIGLTLIVTVVAAIGVVLDHPNQSQIPIAGKAVLLLALVFFFCSSVGGHLTARRFLTKRAPRSQKLDAGSNAS